MVGGAAPRFGIVLVDDKVNRNTIRPATVVNRSNPYMSDFRGELLQRSRQVA
jgi:hypothetical protein